ncbi:hypothetical protein MKW98_015208 [Papaver atlanticum]|uniref:VAN3-binding protein-like auxin canalisation domain-containing protein n=1 Tax=Papaver atlanticum TaxID=357466 RepID=A0AAD4T8U9_9MAGN|nr:hypothetical protein MKW98_015208 [Papaver atlanticum]
MVLLMITFEVTTLTGSTEKKKEETRAHNAQLHAAIFVAVVASVVAAIAAAIAASAGSGKHEQIAKTVISFAWGCNLKAMVMFKAVSSRPFCTTK